MDCGGVTRNVYNSLTGQSEARAMTNLLYIGNAVKDNRYPRKTRLVVELKDEDDRGDSPGGPSARGHPGHMGEDGPSSDPESWWRGRPGPEARVGPAERVDEDAAFARMRAILEAEDRERDSEEDYATANEEPSSDDADEGDSDDEWEEQAPARPGCQVSGNIRECLLLS